MVSCGVGRPPRHFLVSPLGKLPGGVRDSQRPPRRTAHLRSEFQLLRVPVFAVGAREVLARLPSLPHWVLISSRVCSVL